jgi:hypothetical protein
MASAGQETGREVATGPSGTDGRPIRETSVACSKVQLMMLIGPFPSHESRGFGVRDGQAWAKLTADASLVLLGQPSPHTCDI